VSKWEMSLFLKNMRLADGTGNSISGLSKVKM